ncbi:LuxR family transcriptional regulator [Blastococcus sp. CT_GayMR20]|uniref:LuxR family transcriptional regulator n=1 Tax=Blastococcus sp. CT_GayMR20 TaxID=2559609 RepID=UPI001072ED46|nr:LuxR family transcriptional regulator [Blastococcus sp. CT_GayMR20]TFV88696.1 LuxR family transcriptional regulator [Blastococcus sp. CT_GayMR20]TFV88727.1 LuxR family transcriptional regulator [Blastococcus sp. CT_GayMR20]
MSPDPGVVDVQALEEELTQRAGTERSGRAARTLPHPVDGLRQTVVALRGGAALGEHESPGPASLLVLRGRVRLVAGEEVFALGTHEFAPLPDRRHSLHADEDSVVLLSIAVSDRAPLT